MNPESPWGYDSWTHTEVVPKPPPRHLRWTVGPVRPKRSHPSPGPPGSPPSESEFTVQLTADQQVDLSISGEDAYDNPVDISGDIVWTSSDPSIVTVTADTADAKRATAVAVGPIGTAAVTVSNDVNQDGTGDFQGSIAIDVVAGDIAEIVVTAGTPTDKA
jgi:hypothetical protein